LIESPSAINLKSAFRNPKSAILLALRFAF
jgi:hypothetical protein